VAHKHLTARMPDSAGHSAADDAAPLRWLLDELGERLDETGLDRLAFHEVLTDDQLRFLRRLSPSQRDVQLHGMALARYEDACARHEKLRALAAQANRHRVRETNLLTFVDRLLSRALPGAE
jgi:hypothetical protein